MIIISKDLKRLILYCIEDINWLSKQLLFVICTSFDDSCGEKKTV